MGWRSRSSTKRRCSCSVSVVSSRTVERIANRVELALVEEGCREASLPQGHEPVELDDGRLFPARLIEDELIVSIPLVPKHARVEDCGSLADDLATLTEEGSAAARRATDL